MTKQAALQKSMYRVIKSRAVVKGLRMDDVAKLSGLGRSAFYERMNGKSAVRAYELDDIARPVEMTGEELLIEAKKMVSDLGMSTSGWSLTTAGERRQTGNVYIVDFTERAARRMFDRRAA